MASDPLIRLAVRRSLPLLLPALPFGVTLGVVMRTSVMPLGVAWASNHVVFAGAAQLAMVGLAATSTWLTLVATCAVINARHVMYSAAMAPRFAAQPRWFRWVAPMFLIDQTFALTDATDYAGADLRRFYGASAALFYSCWTLFVATGLLLGDLLPASWRLEFAPAVMFLGMVVLGLRGRIRPGPGIVSAVVATAVTLATIGLPNNLGLLVGAVAGVVAGSMAEGGST